MWKVWMLGWSNMWKVWLFGWSNRLKERVCEGRGILRHHAGRKQQRSARQLHHAAVRDKRCRATYASLRNVSVATQCMCWCTAVCGDAHAFSTPPHLHNATRRPRNASSWAAAPTQHIAMLLEHTGGRNTTPAPHPPHTPHLSHAPGEQVAAGAQTVLH
eukprot:358899-Chlamydomonas_euryale.AAC.4